MCTDKTKIDESYPDSQFKIDEYQYPPFRRDRNCKGSGKNVYIREVLLPKDCLARRQIQQKVFAYYNIKEKMMYYFCMQASKSM